MDTQVIDLPEGTMMCAIAAATVIEAGDLVTLTSGLVTKATATSTKVARAQEAHAASGPLRIEVSKGNAKLRMDSSDVFAVTQRATEYDIAVSVAGKATINQSGTTYKVLQMSPDENAGVVGATTNVEVIINKPLDQRA